jgi:hypothetical protein
MQVRHGAGQIHYFIGGGGGFGSGSGSTGGEIATWVNQHFAVVTVDGVTKLRPDRAELLSSPRPAWDQPNG